MRRAELDRAVLEWIREGVEAPADEERFDRLARALFAHQYEHNAPYRRLCRAAGRVRVDHWREIPAVPTGAFKEARLACFPERETVRVFRTSGSTTKKRGELHLDTLALYEASLLETFGAFVCTGQKPVLMVLAPSAADAPDSSLSYMFDCALRELAAPGSRCLVERDGWDPESAIAILSEQRDPVALVGTAFAFVHLVDALRARSLRLELPPGSRAMETGGFKGRSRELSREELHAAIEHATAIPAPRIVNQYGMCELQSQFYEPTLRSGRASRRKCVPPWVRTRVLDPATLDDVPEGAVGVLVHYDLANTAQVLAVQTSDAGRLFEDGFEVLGRVEGAEARGCSLAADALLGASS